MKRFCSLQLFPRGIFILLLVGTISLLPFSNDGNLADDLQSAMSFSKSIEAAPADRPTPSIVTISGSEYSYVYTVNGVQQTIRGVGYNPIYRHLSPEERAAMYDRDFWLMWRSGINMIEGWDQDKGYMQDKFDELLLSKAERYGIGVIMPFYLAPDNDYTDLELRKRISEEVATWVYHFKDYPAVRMWGLGNEVLYVMPPERWDEQQVAFAEFLVQLADMVHAIDPNHPVIYRESEDVYIPILRQAMLADGVERRWFVYGMNVYTFRLNQILQDWPYQGLDVPLLVSEFAPVGLRGDARAKGYAEMWRTLRSYPSTVLGGLAYVWTTEGPEPVDQEFGLLDDRAVAVDDSFNQLVAEFLGGEMADTVAQSIGSDLQGSR